MNILTYSYTRDDAKLRELYAAERPTWPVLEPIWFHAYPTLVGLEDDGSLVGYTSYSMNLTENGHLIIWGKDTVVAPAHRGKGHAGAFLDARLSIGRQLGAIMFAGTTRINNVPMRKLLVSRNAVEQGPVPDAYPHDTPTAGVLYTIGL